MTREMNKPDWHRKFMTKYKCLICKRGSRPECHQCLYFSNPSNSRELDDWIKPYIDSINERFKQNGN